MKVDVAIFGGGSAGVAAAVAAARAGATVALVERQAALGGTGSASMVHSICGLYRLRASDTETLEWANPGFPKEFAETLLACGSARGPIRMGKLDVLLHQPAAFAELSDRLTASETRIQVFLHSELLELKTCGDGIIQSATVQCRGSRLALESTAVIDTTGDGEAAALAGASCSRVALENLQRPAIIVALGGMPPAVLTPDRRLQIAHTISSAVMDGQLPSGVLGAGFRDGVHPEQVWCTIDLEAPGFDPSSRESLSSAEREGRYLATLLLSFLKKNLAPFQNAYIAAFPAHLGIRENRRIDGLYELTVSDILNGARFDDEVAFSAWPMEMRESARGPRFQYPTHPCGIPLRSLRSRSCPNLFMAGRCISASHEAQAAIRVMGTCLATGEAAGKAAAAFTKSAANNC